jgi:phage head maturation protease
MNDDILISFGSSVKARGARGFQGYGLLFGGIDLDGESFPEHVNLELDGRVSLPTYWCHSLDPKVGNRKLADADFKITSQGLYVSGEFRRLDAVENQIMSEIHRGTIGFSSGSSPHLVRKQKRGAVTEIVSWPVAEISLTPKPVEPRTKALPLKALKDLLARDAGAEYETSQEYYNERAEAEWQRFCDLRARFELQQRGIYVD